VIPVTRHLSPVTWAYVLVSAPLGVMAGLALGRLVLLVLNAALVFPVFALYAARQRHGQNVALMLLWAFMLAVSVTTATLLAPEWVGPRIIRGEAYKAEMFRWIETGAGPEGDPRQFIPQHAKHYALFLVLSLVSGGALALAMGAVLMNYMSFYVGCLFLATESDWIVLLMGWPVWSVVRVVGFVVAAVALSEVFYPLVRRSRPNWPTVGRYMAVSLGLIVADILLKSALAPVWQRVLQAALTSPPAAAG